MPKTIQQSRRIGLIVPSSNTTMETEIPAILRGRAQVQIEESFTFHSSRMRMKKVTKAELEQMDLDSLRCATELADAAVDVVGYACLVAIMAMGRGYHCLSQQRLAEQMSLEGHNAPVITSAGALVEELKLAGVRSVSIITPYVQALTNLVVDYMVDQSINVVDSISLGIPDNLEVGRRDPMALLSDVDRLNITGVDAVVISACVQMPSLSAIRRVEDKIGLPVTSAAVCTVRSMLRALGLKPVAHSEAGYFLTAQNLRPGTLHNAVELQ